MVYWTFYVLHETYFSGCKCTSQLRLDGKTVIITGASAGIGEATALDLAKRGARVVMACRNEAKTTPVLEKIKLESGNDNVTFKQLDLSSFRSIKEFAMNFLKTENRLNILINNGGIVSKDLEFNENGIELTMMTNHVGPFYLTQLLQKILIDSGPGSRIVNVASFAHMFANPKAFTNFDSLLKDGTKMGMGIPYSHIPMQYWFYELRARSAPVRRYANSKLANVLFTRHLAERVKETGVTVYSLHPGAVLTKLLFNSSIASMTPIFLAQQPPLSFLLRTPEEGAQTSICCAVSKEFSQHSGFYYSDCQPQELATPDAKNLTLAEEFWQWTENIVKKHSF